MIAPETLLLHDNSGPDAGESLLFSAPSRVLVARRPDEVAGVLEEAQAALAAGHYVAGFLSYDLGLTLEERLRPLCPGNPAVPLAWLGIFGPPQRLDRAGAWALVEGDGEAAIEGLELGISEAEYRAAFEAVQAYIAAGDVYQVNLTLQAHFHLKGAPLALYRALCRKQPVAHGAFLDTDELSVLSLSPELFVENSGGDLTARPMKGTIRRGRTNREDAVLKAELASDIKSRAENLMIVDLLRNDLGRIAETGSVYVDDLFSVETYRSLHTMTSTVRARMRPGTGMVDVLNALFPCGSVTGAPKIRAMQIIGEVEAGPRGLYTGSLGYFAPNGDFRFNVAIRTALVEAGGQGSIGVGGGIVADSQLDAEWAECALKLDFFRSAAEPEPPLGLIETLLWEEGRGFALLERHLARMADSAAYLAIPFDRATALATLDSVAGQASRLRVRLVLDEDGGLSVTATPLAEAGPASFRFALAQARTSSENRFLFHKTTRRTFYDQTRAAMAETLGVAEAVFCNERGELTEGSFTTLFIERDGVLLTPALDCGLLPGTLRAELLASGRAREAVLFPRDLESAEAVWLGNSVRGLVRGEWVRSADK